jgi:hypothetical protein
MKTRQNAIVSYYTKGSLTLARSDAAREDEWRAIAGRS